MLMQNKNADCEEWETAPAPFAYPAMAYGARFAARVNAISMDSWESVKPVANTRWRGDYFPHVVTCALTGENVICGNITVQKSHQFVQLNVTYNYPKEVSAVLQPCFYWYSKHDCWALDKDPLLPLMLYMKKIIFTSQILSHVLKRI